MWASITPEGMGVIGVNHSYKPQASLRGQGLPRSTLNEHLEYATDGLLNFLGGCCGTFPSRIAVVVQEVKGCPPRAWPELLSSICMII